MNVDWEKYSCCFVSSARIKYGSNWRIFIEFTIHFGQVILYKRFKVSILQLSGWGLLLHLCTSHNEISLPFTACYFSFDVQNALIVYSIRQIKLFHVKKDFATHAHRSSVGARVLLNQTKCGINATVFEMFLCIMYSSKLKLSQCILWWRQHLKFEPSLRNEQHEKEDETEREWQRTRCRKRNHKHSSYVLWLYVNSRAHSPSLIVYICGGKATKSVPYRDAYIIWRLVKK